MKMFFRITIVFFLLSIAGCIISASPSTLIKIMMQPGETYSFKIEGPDKNNCSWHIFQNDMTVKSKYDVTQWDLVPNKELAGEIKIVVFESITYCEVEPTITCNSINTGIRTWKAEVAGLTATPLSKEIIDDSRLIETTTGSLLEFTAKAYPKSNDYDYSWTLNDVSIGNNSSILKYQFDAPGEYKITLKASGWEENQSELLDSISWIIKVS